MIKKYKDKFKWISEKDNGQTDAINKGLRMCSGDWFAFLNACDYYESGTYDTSDPSGHFRLNSKVIKGGYDAQGSKRGIKA